MYRVLIDGIGFIFRNLFGSLLDCEDDKEWWWCFWGWRVEFRGVEVDCRGGFLWEVGCFYCFGDLWIWRCEEGVVVVFGGWCGLVFLRYED